MAIQVLKDKCVGCGACVSACPFSAISMVDGKASIGTACTACGVCVSKCPVSAIEKTEDENDLEKKTETIEEVPKIENETEKKEKSEE